ncbi:hypothetical protein MTO96_011911 [Rhipicephalus appendiculatus]
MMPGASSLVDGAAPFGSSFRVQTRFPGPLSSTSVCVGRLGAAIGGASRHVAGCSPSPSRPPLARRLLPFRWLRSRRPAAVFYSAGPCVCACTRYGVDVSRVPAAGFAQHVGRPEGRAHCSVPKVRDGVRLRCMQGS